MLLQTINQVKMCALTNDQLPLLKVADGRLLKRKLLIVCSFKQNIFPVRFFL